ncbi:rRNA processing/ribosome biogenesis-domain-containing protein [Dipodascopsis uninucleata]
MTFKGAQPRMKLESSGQLRSLLNTYLSPEQEVSLPNHVGTVSEHLRSASIISASDEQILHRIRVRISALLQSSSTTIRGCGAELAYAMCESDWDSIGSHGATWVGLLLTIIDRKGEGIATIDSCVRAVSLILSRCHGKPTLTREIATPNIPGFASALLSHQGEELDITTLSIILPALLCLEEAFPVTFRPFMGKTLSNIVFPVLNFSTSEKHILDAKVEHLARKVYVNSYRCASKGSVMEWRVSLLKVIGELHATISKVLDIVVEDERYENLPSGWELSPEISDRYSGILRIELLLRVLETFFTVKTDSVVEVPLAQVIHVLNRLLYVDIKSVEFKATADKAERDFLIFSLASIHSNVFAVLNSVAKATTYDFLPHISTTYSLLATTLSNPETARRPIFDFLSTTIQLVGLLSPKVTEDIIPAVTSAIDVMTNLPPQGISLPDFLGQPEVFSSGPIEKALVASTTLFLSTVLASAPHLPPSVRSQVDRFTLISPYSIPKMVLNSVLQPGENIKYSILPMAARELGSDIYMSALLHPRFPPVPYRKEDLPFSINRQILSALKRHNAQNDSEENAEMDSDDSDNDSAADSMDQDQTGHARDAERKRILDDNTESAEPKRPKVEDIIAIPRPNLPAISAQEKQSLKPEPAAFIVPQAQFNESEDITVIDAEITAADSKHHEIINSPDDGITLSGKGNYNNSDNGDDDDDDEFEMPAIVVGSSSDEED